ncbi:MULTISPECIES: acyltransferase [unclassified Pseudoxanthomonas]|uniref:acyltransferase family protein n=1 Tax=unclassified Pseudoxanthomonas TaxID=2645906 RepID=UPI003076F488
MGLPEMVLAQKLLPFQDKNVPYLDAIRGVAVLFILIRHAWGLSGSPPFSLGVVDLTPLIVMMSSGVDLFFVLSGMLLSSRFLKNDASGRPSPSISHYMRARILRIGPPYWVVLFLVVLLYTPHYIDNARVWSEWGAANFIAHATFMQTAFIWSFGTYGVASPFWTLTIEMMFYLSLPFVVPLFYKGRWWQGVVASVLVSIVWLYLARNGLTWLVDVIGRHDFDLPFNQEVIRFNLSHQILSYLPHFAIGCAISVILQRFRGRTLTSELMGLIYFGLGILVVVAMMYFLGDISMRNGFANPTLYILDFSRDARAYYYLESIPFAFGYGLILLGASLASNKLKANISSFPLLCIAGVLGYSIYLIHMPLLYTIRDHAWFAMDPRPYWKFFKLLFAGGGVVFLCSLGLFYAVERPSMLLANRASPVRDAVKEEVS